MAVKSAKLGQQWYTTAETDAKFEPIGNGSFYFDEEQSGFIFDGPVWFHSGFVFDGGGTDGHDAYFANPVEFNSNVQFSSWGMFHQGLEIWGGLTVDTINGQPVSMLGGGGLPKVAQIRLAHPQGKSFGHAIPQGYANNGVTLILDKPAPANCYIQFFRYSKRSGLRYHTQDPRYKAGFRAIDISNAEQDEQPYWVLPVPEGVTRVETASLSQLYRPNRLRGSGYRYGSKERSYQRVGFRHSYEYGNPDTPIVFADNFENKCLYKFGVKIGKGHESGNMLPEMSSNTLEIKHYFQAKNGGSFPPTNANGSPRSADLVARIY
jgi:hypothetical protein